MGDLLGHADCRGEGKIPTNGPCYTDATTNIPCVLSDTRLIRRMLDGLVKKMPLKLQQEFVEWTIDL